MEEETKGGCCKGASVNESVTECCCESAPVEEPACGCNGSVSEDKTYVAKEGSCACGGNGCHIKVLGAGCKSCHEQHENVKKAVADMNLDAEVEYITDGKDVFMAYMKKDKDDKWTWYSDYIITHWMPFPELPK